MPGAGSVKATEAWDDIMVMMKLTILVQVPVLVVYLVQVHRVVHLLYLSSLLT